MNSYLKTQHWAKTKKEKPRKTSKKRTKNEKNYRKHGQNRTKNDQNFEKTPKLAEKSAEPVSSSVAGFGVGGRECYAIRRTNR
jgi:hypothetical protein